MTASDLDLLKQYARDNAQDAFAEIVRRHLGLVYSAAFRQVRSAQLAEEIAQSTFTDLARQAPHLAPDTILSAWLYEVTRRAAIDVVRREARRQLREQIATEMNAMHATAADWTHIEPLLDEAMHALDATDRAAVLLRYFENKSLREVGQALGTSDDAAQKRVSRAVERLREFFTRRGVTVGTSGLAVVISANAVQAAPVGLAATLCHAAFASTAVGNGTLGILKFMTATKLKASVIGAIVVASGVATLVIQQQSQAKAHSADASLQQQADQLAALQFENQRLSSLVALSNRPAANSLAELQRLRDEAAALRRRANDLAAVREENRQLQASLAKARKELFYPDRQPIPPTEETKARTWYCMNLAVALLEYASDHQGQIPASFDQAAKSISERFLSEGIEHKANLTPDQFEITYQGSRDALTNYAHPGRILLVRERQPWQHPDGRWMKVYAFTDGSGTVHSEPKDQFEAWETSASSIHAIQRMNIFKNSVCAVVLAVVVFTPFLVRHRAGGQMREKREMLWRQAALMGDLLAENKRLSNLMVEAKSFQPLSGAEVAELARVRNEISQHQDARKETDRLQREARRIRDGLQELPKEKELDSSTALLADEMAVRLARVKGLKQWLEENPEEKIPELQFLSDSSWIRSADRQRITDEEFRGWMSAQRANAEAWFSSMAFKALKQYAKANTGMFPADVAQLRPYFESPVDDEILQRYKIVPAKNLIKFLADAGGDWVITQKAPIDKKRDSRIAISTTDNRGTSQEGRWDPVP